MPRKQVYGKRSRAIYDPFQAFVSPQRPAPKGNIKSQGIFVAEVIEELSRLNIVEKKSEDGSRSGRRALGEKSANETVESVKTSLQGGKTRRRGRKGVRDTIEDVENEPSTEQDSKVELLQRQSSNRLRRKKPDETAAAVEPVDTRFVADNVLMFLDGHGYDTEDEDAGVKESASIPETSRSRSKETSQASETPSISILPPTPSPEDDEHTRHCAPLLKLSSHEITNFTEWSNQLTNHFTITKIAEASFGEVYRLSLLEDLSSFSHSDESVLKIIALKPPKSALTPTSRMKDRAAAPKKTEAMSKVSDVANEVKLLQRMSTIPGFTNFRDVRVMQGRPPVPFIKAFKDFNAEQKARKKDPSAFPDPAKKTSYAEDQLWAVIEMQDAGVDLERRVEQGECRSVWAVWDVFWQVVLTLAKGEEGAEFEHRDLHLGNICVRGELATRNEDDEGVDTKRKLNFIGLETTIIDYTISRALLSTKSPPPASTTATATTRAKHENIAFHDLSTPHSASIFEGDSTEEYQYDIYRYMRGCVLTGDPYYNPPASHTTPPPLKPTTPPPWSTYTPSTNLLWLHYLLHSLLEQLAWPSATKAPTRKRNGGRDHAVWKRANDLEHVLLRVQELLDPGVVCAVGGGGLGSAGALVGWALEEGWLGVGDVAGEEGEGSEIVEEGDRDGGLDGKAVGEGETLDAVVVQGEEAPAAGEGRRGGRTRKKG